MAQSAQVEFSSRSHFITAARPGDRWTVEDAVDKRRIVTYVMLERTGEHAAVIENIVTHHYGRPEYAGRPDRCYISSARPIPTEVDGPSIRESFGLYDGKTQMLGRVDARPRYSANALRTAHAQAVRVYDQLVAAPDAAAS